MIRKASLLLAKIGRMMRPSDLYYSTHEVDGEVIRVAARSSRSSGPSLLICNGIGANIELLEPLADALKPRSIIMFDVPGAGGSSTPVLPYRLQGLSNKIVQLLDQMGHSEPVDVMGISWGGVLAQSLAFHHPKRFRKLILAATGPGTIMVPGKLDVLLKLISPKRYSDKDFLRKHAGEIYGGRFRTAVAAAEVHGEEIVAPTGRGYLYQLLATFGWSSLPWLWLIRQPTLILHGNDDPIVPLVNAKIMAGLLPDAQLKELDDGHLFMLTSAQPTASLIEEFLNA